MARRTFDVIDVTEILVHWHAGRSLNEMSQSLGVDRKTIRKYAAPAIAAGITPGGQAKSEAQRVHCGENGGVGQLGRVLADVSVTGQGQGQRVVQSPGGDTLRIVGQVGTDLLPLLPAGPGLLARGC